MLSGMDKKSMPDFLYKIIIFSKQSITRQYGLLTVVLQLDEE